jgi:hypothetical protein
MNDNGHRHVPAAANPISSHANDSGRNPPALHIVLRLEQPAELVLAAETLEDEVRLRSWLRRSRALQALPAAVERLLDELDRDDLRRAA